jgi:hypothetical protein
MGDGTHRSATTIALPVGGNGEVAIIDRCDAELVAGFTWRLLSNGYVGTQRGQMYILIHRLIAGAGPDEFVDHINCDRLDNRAANLRIATKSENGANRGPDRRRLGTSSRHKGVFWDSARKRWAATIHINGKTRSLGRHLHEDDAARAYNSAALRQWGEFARLNDVGTPPPASDAAA